VAETPEKPPARPAWWKNTYFWIAAALFGIGLLGLRPLGGDPAIRDPGQRREDNLYLLYFGAAAVMLINGIVTHSQTLQHYRETVGQNEAT
jgi:hypothetical protein